PPPNPAACLRLGRQRLVGGPPPRLQPAGAVLLARLRPAKPGPPRLRQGRRPVGRNRPAARRLRNVEALVPQPRLLLAGAAGPPPPAPLRRRDRPDLLVAVHRRPDRHP